MKELCAIRDVCRSITDYENKFQKEFFMCLNEGMILCCLKDKRLSSGEIAEQINLTCSNTSKLLRSVEEKNYIERVLGEKDKRQMYFVLSKVGEKMLHEIEGRDLKITYPLSLLIEKLS